MKKRLERKGWHPKHIDEAQSILDLSQVSKHPSITKVENSMFWFTLVTSILGTALISIAIIPILVIANNTHSYILVGLLGMLLGILIRYISRRMHWLKQHHKVSLLTVAPIIGLFNMFLVVRLVNDFNQFASISNYHNPTLVGIIYLVSFMLPHFLWGDFK